MEITYLGHSGFLVETSAAYYLFDYIRGDLPEFERTKRLYVFVSHAHQDHWNAGIFTDVRLKNADCFILGFDIQEPFEAMTREDPGLAELPVRWAHPQQTIETIDFSCLSDAFLGRPRTWQNIPRFSEISTSGPSREISPDPLRGGDLLPVIIK